mgnify:CR=1 FL=1
MAVLLAALVGLAWLAYVRTGALRTVARGSRQHISRPVGDRRWVAWRQTDQGRQAIMLLRGRGRPRELLARARLSEPAASGWRLFVGEADGELLSVDARTGRVEAISRTRGETDHMVVGDGHVWWLEHRAAALPGVPFVSAGAPVSVIRTAPITGGEARVVAVTPRELGRVYERPGTGRPLELVGAAEGRLYWLERRQAGRVLRTELRRGAPGRAPEILAVEPGAHTAALIDGTLAWTGPSDEAMIPTQYIAVRRMNLADGEVRTIADWLARETILLGSDKRLYAQQQDLLWRLGQRRGQQRIACRRTGPFQAAAVIGDREYLVAGLENNWRIVERPLTWWARVRRLVGR